MCIWLDIHQQFIFSLTQFNRSGFFVFVSQENLWVWRRRFTLLIGLVVGFLGLVVLLEIWVWFFVGLLLRFLFFICLFGWWVYEVYLCLILNAGLCVCFLFFYFCNWIWVYLFFIDGCLLDRVCVLIQDTLRSRFMWFLVFNSVFNLFYLVKINKLIFLI